YAHHVPADDVVNVTISLATVLPSRQGFGTILLAANHDIVGPRVRTVTRMSDAEDQGFTAAAYPAIHAALTVAFSQNPRPRRIKVGRRDLHTTQSWVLTPAAAQGTGYVWTITIDGTDVTYTEE